MLHGPIANGLTPQIQEDMKAVLLSKGGGSLLKWYERELEQINEHIWRVQTWEEYLEYRGQYTQLTRAIALLKGIMNL
ncbi:hypothetical protein KKH13_04290 [Patescibacteria group bacterium]|nr:hypothetical protein [Patescibacteria group bacterium]